MNKLTPKQERFCLGYIELGNASEAYRRAYDCTNMKSTTINRNAHAMLAKNKIVTRVNQLKANLAAQTAVTVGSITAELEAARALAMAEKLPAAAVTAAMGKAKIHGFVKDKQDVTLEDKRDSDALKTVHELMFGQAQGEPAIAAPDQPEPTKH